jgi:very-short-patch-repair endonuclease
MARSRNTSIARRMRKGPTANEAKLWRLLRNRRLSEIKFRRQVPLGPYIADFLSFDRHLVIEADGPFHTDAERDARRDRWFASQGFRVLRFPNELIDCDHRGVLAAILEAANP